MSVSFLISQAKSVQKVIDENSAEIEVLDQKIGDGDHIFNIQRGLKLVVELEDAIKDLPLAKALNMIAMKVLSGIGGSSGALFGTFFIIGGTFGAVVGGVITDKFGPKFEGGAMTVLTISYLILTPLTISYRFIETSGLFFYFTLFFISVNVTFWVGPIFAAMQTLTPYKVRSTMLAVFILGVNIIGMGLGSFVTGYLADYVFNKEIPIVIGGPHVAIFPEETQKIEGVTYSMKGECDESFLQLVNVIDQKGDFQSVPGLYWEENGITKSNPVSNLIDDLDQIPVPMRELLNYKKYHSEQIYLNKWKK